MNNITVCVRNISTIEKLVNVYKSGDFRYRFHRNRNNSNLFIEKIFVVTWNRILKALIFNAKFEVTEISLQAVAWTQNVVSFTTAKRISPQFIWKVKIADSTSTRKHSISAMLLSRSILLERIC